MHTISIKTPVDLVQAIDYLITFRPQHSIVAMSAQGHPTARVDAGPGAVAAIADPFNRYVPGHGVVIVVYDVPRVDAEAYYDEAQCLIPGTLAGFWVNDDMVHSLDKEESWSLAGTSTAAAQAVAAGLTAAPDRASLAERFALTEPRYGNLEPVEEVAAAAWLAEQSTKILAGEGTEAELDAWASYVAINPSVRDNGWTCLTRDNVRAAIPVLEQVARGTGGPARGSVLAILAFAYWLSGNGGSGNVAVDACLETDPGNSLGRLVDGILRAGAPPSTWEGMAPV